MQFIVGLSGGQGFHPRLRVKQVHGHPGVWERGPVISSGWASLASDRLPSEESWLSQCGLIFSDSSG